MRLQAGALSYCGHWRALGIGDKGGLHVRGWDLVCFRTPSQTFPALTTTSLIRVKQCRVIEYSTRLGNRGLSRMIDREERRVHKPSQALHDAIPTFIVSGSTKLFSRVNFSTSVNSGTLFHPLSIISLYSPATTPSYISSFFTIISIHPGYPFGVPMRPPWVIFAV
ncbi:hypothetical protein BDQ17DRAFT_848074 [Cyathus striatus]|nr:hypothetical protein BDQ17DRAFT_848074 [Cyathus striatus]